MSDRERETRPLPERPTGEEDAAIQPTSVGDLLARVTARAPRKPAGGERRPPPEAPRNEPGPASALPPSAGRPAGSPASAGPSDRAVAPGAVREIRRAVGEGWEPVLVVGARATGKSTFLAAAGRSRRGLLGPPVGAGPGPTRTLPEPGAPASVAIRRGRRRRLLVEPPEGEVRGRIVDGLIPRLRGLVVLLDLESVVRSGGTDALEGVQRALLTLRWRRGPGRDGRSSPSPEDMARELAAAPPWSSRRLDLPVEVLFSRADRLVGLPVGGGRPALFPAGEDPLLLAWHLLPRLLELLGEHARRFRLDFVHCRVEEGDERPCGLDAALAWIVAESGPGRWSAIPTTVCIAWLRWWDRQRGRRRRWELLLPPRSLL